MNRTMIWTLLFSLALASAAGAAPTAEEKCQAAKLDALRKRTFCIEGEQRNEVLGKTPDTAKCDDKFDTAIMKADVAAAKKGASCRWLDNGDGTATDLNYGLQWEIKTDDGSVHDKDNIYTWNTTAGGTTPNGTAFTAFLGTLNGGVSMDASTTVGCFAGHCDWRLPTIGELRSMLDAQNPSCTMSPCTTIPGFTRSGPSDYYLSSSTLSPPGLPNFAWNVFFTDGYLRIDTKDAGGYARAVRGGA
jgi:uncharacterized protein DUF1566